MTRFPHARRPNAIRAAVITVVLACLPFPAAADPSQAAATASTGLRMGESTVEGFADFLVPLAERGDGVLLLNPRISLKDEGESEANLGLVWRSWLPDANVVLGANAWLDSRESRHGNRFNQWGAGVELLGERIDARVNWYDADNDLEMTREHSTREIESRTEVSTRRDISVRREVDVDVSTETGSEVISVAGPAYGEPYGSEHSILQDIEQDVTREVVTDSLRTTTATELRTVRTTRTTRRFTTITDRLFRQYETGLDGFDAEIGLKLPLADGAPEVRVFAGYYDFDNPFGEDIDGYKGRIEVRAGPYLTFDAEVFDDERLNGTDYFVGFRLHVPLHGRDTWKKFRQGLRGAAGQSVAARRYSDMVMRDVRVQTAESEPTEILSHRRQATEVKTDRQVSESTDSSTTVSRQSRTTTETVTGTQIVETETIRDDVTFVDADNDASTGDGTFEDPFRSLQDGADGGAASGNNTIFLCEAGSDGLCERSGGTGSYDETVVLSDNQVLTSSIEANDGKYFETVNRPEIAPTTGGAQAAVQLADVSTVHRIRVDTSAAGSMNAIRSTSTSTPALVHQVITDNELRTAGGIGIALSVSGNDADILIRGNDVSGNGSGISLSGVPAAGSVLIDDNTVDTQGVGIYTSLSSTSVDITISNNSVTTHADGAHGIYDYPYQGTETTITGNAVTTHGDGADGILKMSSTQPTAGTISNNTVVTTGTGNDAIHLGVANGSSTCNTVTGNNVTAGNGRAIHIGTFGSGIQVSAADAAELASDNMLNGGNVVDDGGTFGCTP